VANIIKIRKNFFYLLQSDDFSFTYFNFFQNCSGISLKTQIDTDFMRNMHNSALVSSKIDKFKFILTGNGILEHLPQKELFFVSSLFKLRFFNENKRKIAFDYLFEKDNVPYEDKASNLAGNKDDKFFLPIIKVFVSKQTVIGNKWSLKLEEI